MGQINNQAPIEIKARVPNLAGTQPKRAPNNLNTLNDQQKSDLSSSAEYALKNPDSSIAEGFKNAGITDANDLEKLAKGQFSELGTPIPQGQLNNLVAIAEQADLRPADNSVDETVIGQAIDTKETGSLQAPQQRSAEELSMVDDIWGANSQIIDDAEADI